MNKKIITLATTILLNTLILPSAMAEKSAEDCLQLGSINNNLSEKSRCLDGVIAEMDRELQTWVNLHIFNLEEKALVNGRYSALKMFKRSQTNFITFRENDCRWQYLAVSPEQGAGIAYKTCYIVLGQNRINELENVSSSPSEKKY